MEKFSYPEKALTVTIDFPAEKPARQRRMIERCDHMHYCGIVPFDWGNINGRFILFYGFDSLERAEMAVARYKESNITAHILPRFAPGETQAWVDAMPTEKDKLVSALEEIDVPARQDQPMDEVKRKGGIMEVVDSVLAKTDGLDLVIGPVMLSPDGDRDCFIVITSDPKTRFRSDVLYNDECERMRSEFIMGLTERMPTVVIHDIGDVIQMFKFCEMLRSGEPIGSLVRAINTLH